MSTHAWEGLALCRRSRHPERWWGPTGAQDTAYAARICHRCPVQTACLDDALEHEGDIRPEHRAGIWGGLSPDERFDLARSRAVAA